MIPQSFIQDLLNRVDIVDVVGNYVQLKKGGANLLGLCPFHGEKTPSFTVSPSKQFYHCFGCGKNGTAIGFLMEYTGVGFVEAVKTLAQNVGMTVPEEDDRLPPTQRAEQQARSLALSDALTQAYHHYRKQLRTAPQAIDYLKQRGLTGEIAAHFGLGYAPDAWDSLRAIFPDYEAGALVESGLVIDRSDENDTSRKRYDRFRDRIIFPIRNSKGQTIGFGGRVLDKGEPKYLNSPETPLFHKGSELYGLFEARQAIRDTGYALVTEGYMDVVALAQLGFPQAVATLGTACTPTHVQKLLRQTDCVIFSFDGDAAGRRAARRALEASLPHAADNKTIKFLFLPPEHDPDSYVREFGAEAFDRMVQDAMPLSEFLLQEIAEGNDANTAEGRARMQFVAKPLLNAMPASALRLQIVRGLAQLTQTSTAELEGVLELSRPLARGRQAPPRQKRPQPVGLERKIARLLLAHPPLAFELDSATTKDIARFAPDSADMLSQLLDTVHSMGEQASFATVSEQLRLAGPDFDALIAEIATAKDFDLELTRAELADAIRQIRMQAITAELNQLSSSGLGVEQLGKRYRELTQQKEQLRQQIEKTAEK
ncbi:MAG: DNA primase [Burkholderiaceae bacterium]|nr:DNA primase [Burkholderiaceae bacterium]